MFEVTEKLTDVVCILVVLTAYVVLFLGCHILHAHLCVCMHPQSSFYRSCGSQHQGHATATA